jgi:hypothetical protein
MVKRRILIIIAMSLGLQCRFAAAQIDASRAAIEERAIWVMVVEYALHIRSALPHKLPKQIVIEPTTVAGGGALEASADARKDWESELKRHVGCAYQPSDGPDPDLPLDPTLCANWVAAWHTPRAVPADLPLAVPYVLASFKAPAGTFWNAFYKKYPRSAGIIAVSNVGFDDTLTVALIYYEHTYGLLGGGGGYLLLRRDDRGWHIERVLGGWES